MTPAQRRAIATVATAAVTTLPLLTAGSSYAGGGSPEQVYRVPPSGVLVLQGHGYGHGHGMSQFGAYGAAMKGLGYRKIVSFYYPHTTVAGQPDTTTVRVLLHSTGTHNLVVDPAGHRPTASSSVNGVADCRLPIAVGSPAADVKTWRVHVVTTAAGVREKLQATTDGSHWTHLPAKTCGKAWAAPQDGSISLAGPAATRLVRTAGGVTRYRGALRAAFTGSHLVVVDVVRLDDYLRSVVPSEMPSSWSQAALRAQAVAARTYASYGIAHPKSPYFDVFDDTRDQMYTGVGSEIASTDEAVTATTNPTKHVSYVLHDASGHAAFTQFSSSDGGWTVAGGQPYLPAEKDPYDGVPQVSWSPHSWTTSLSASSIESAFPSIGTLRSIVVDQRDGHGQWGGRIVGLSLHGSKGAVSLSGSSFRYDFGLRSEWFRVLEPPTRPAQPTAVRTSSSAVKVGWLPSTAHSGAPVTGYRVTLSPGGITRTVNASTTSLVVKGLKAASDYVVHVSATSAAGSGRAATVTSKVSRVQAPTRVDLATSVSQATFGAGKAGAVVLVHRGDAGDALGAAPLAAAEHAPVLLAWRHGLPPDTKTELKRVLPAGGTVFLLGPTTQLDSDLRSAVKVLGYHVVRLGGLTPDDVAASVANHLAGVWKVTRVVEVSRDDPAAAWAAGPAAALRHAPVLLTDGTTASPRTAHWLARHPAVTKRFAVGSAAVAADPHAIAVAGADDAATATAVAQRFFAAPRTVAVTNSTSVTAGAVSAWSQARRGGPVLFAGTTQLSTASLDYLGSVRADVRAVRLIGAGMPYDDIESGVQRALLG